MIRLAKESEMEDILSVYAYARGFMRSTGNFSQWTNGFPQRELLEEDIKEHRLFVIDCGGICGVFMFLLGDDPTYAKIDGAWLDASPYGVIHRIAGNGKTKGILRQALDFAFERTDHVRIDTHEDNCVMRSLLEKYGFTYCGTIYLADGSPRRAYEKMQNRS